MATKLETIDNTDEMSQLLSIGERMSVSQVTELTSLLSEAVACHERNPRMLDELLQCLCGEQRSIGILVCMLAVPGLVTIAKLKRIGVCEPQGGDDETS